MVVFLVSSAIFLPPGGLQNIWLSVLAISGWALIIYILWKIVVTGRTIWTINENEIKIVWTKKFLLFDGEDILIPWDKIKDIRRGSDPQYYHLKIELLNGCLFEYFHDNGTTNDDFQEMLKMLYKIFNDKKLINSRESSLKNSSS